MAGGQQQQGGGDNSLDFFWGIALVVVAVLCVWFFARAYVVGFIFKVRELEIILINYVLEIWAKISTSAGLPFPEITGLIDAQRAINAGATDSTPFAILAAVSNNVGWFLAFPFAVIMIIMAILVLTSNVGGKFKRIQSMKSLRNAEQRIWSHITPVLKTDLVNTHIDKGPWSMSLQPMAFGKKYKLLTEDRTKHPVTVKLNRGAAAKRFAMQIGPYFSKFENMPPHTQALFAIFAARACRDRKGSNALLEQLSRSSAGQMNYAGARALAAKHINSKEVRYVMVRHAYVMTLMASMLELARTDGVLASAEFLWLKPVDRRLWYMLNSVGRQTPFVEVSGPFAHWLVEQKLGRPMRVPMIDEAVKALEVAIDDIIYEPDDEDG